MVDGGGVLSAHAGPVLIRPEVSVLAPGDGNLVPELGPHATKRLGLSHGQRYLDTFNQNLDK